jgi:hypothetical protein
MLPIGNCESVAAIGLSKSIARQSVHPSARRTITHRAALSDGGHGWPSGLSLVTLCEILIMARFPFPLFRSDAERQGRLRGTESRPRSSIDLRDGNEI